MELLKIKESTIKWIKLPARGFLPKGLYLIRAYVPSTEVESIFTHEIKKGDVGILGYHYATHYALINKPEIL